LKRRPLFLLVSEFSVFSFSAQNKPIFFSVIYFDQPRPPFQGFCFLRSPASGPSPPPPFSTSSSSVVVFIFFCESRICCPLILFLIFPPSLSHYLAANLTSPLFSFPPFPLLRHLFYRDKVFLFPPRPLGPVILELTFL